MESVTEVDEEGTSVFIIKKAKSYKKFESGTWWRTLAKDTGEMTAWFRCPNGHFGTLSDHSIASDGTVSPSVVCPEKGCKFHENIKLEDWNASGV